VDLPYDKQVTLEDLETGEKIQIDPREMREPYREQVQMYLADIRRACASGEVEYHPMYIDQPYDRALVQLLGRR